jgi:hypothetical protein
MVQYPQMGPQSELQLSLNLTRRVQGSNTVASKKFKDFSQLLDFIFKDFARTVRTNYKIIPEYIIFRAFVMSSYWLFLD